MCNLVGILRKVIGMLTISERLMNSSRMEIVLITFVD